VRLRAATEDDAGLLLRWANDPDTRTASFSRGPIDPATHATWLRSVLGDPARRLWIALADDAAVGQGRLDVLSPGDGERISISVAPEARGRRLATPLIAAVCAEAHGDVEAEVRLENTASRRAFEAAGFLEVDRDDDRSVLRWQGPPGA
jgi:RimJ/RimL family protein N-acetyltransferase